MSDIFGIDILKTILGEVNIVIDGGACEGAFTREILKAYPACTVHAFEPQQESYAVLKSNFGDDKRVVANHAALGEKDGVALLRANAANCTSSLLDWELGVDKYVSASASKQTGIQTVQMNTLDTYCFKCHIQQIDLLKLDLQGYEVHALRGAHEILEHTCVVMTELDYVPLYRGQAYASDTEALLTLHGFRLVKYNNANMSGDKVLWQDGIYVK